MVRSFRARARHGASRAPLFFVDVLVGLDATLEKPKRLLGATRIRNFELLAALLVIGGEELCDLREKGLANDRRSCRGSPARTNGPRLEKPAILFCLAILRLLCIDDAHRADTPTRAGASMS